MSKYSLLMAFAERRPITINNIAFRVIHAVEHEDGSGRCFNVTGTNKVGQLQTVFIRTEEP